MSSPSANQTHFRWYQDNAYPDTSDALGAEDRTVAIWKPSKNIILRIQFEQDGSGDMADITPYLHVSVDDGAYAEVGETTTYVNTSDSAYFADSDYAMAERLTPGGGFMGGYYYDSLAGNDTSNLGTLETVEYAWCIQFTTAAKGHNFKFQAVNLGGTPIYFKTPSIDIKAGLNFRFHMQA